MKKAQTFFIFFLMLWSSIAMAQFEDDAAVDDDDLSLGGDIFSDFNEDVPGAQMAEDERYYRYGRFFSFFLGLGLTSFDGNRGQAYENEPPTYGLGLQYFMDFQTSFGIGFEYSKHHFFVDEAVKDFQPNALGLVSVSILRFNFAFRYYIDTADLGTAITYAHPYFTGRLEYWYVANKFEDQSGLGDDSGGGFGFGAGFGGEFPIKIKESYINVEFLFHTVNFHDKFTQAYRPLQPGAFGFDDLTGNVWTTMVNYVMSW